MKKNLFDLALAIVFCLLAQWANSQTSQHPDFNALLNTTLLVTDVRDSRSFADHFMKDAELTDINGEVYLGKNAIRRWHEHMRACCNGAPEAALRIVSRHTRLLRPDLMILLAAVEVRCGDRYSSQVCHCLLHKVDGQWLVETCSITPVAEGTNSAVTAGEGRQNNMLANFHDIDNQ